MGSSCVSRLCSDRSGQQRGPRQPNKKVMKDCATDTSHPQRSLTRLTTDGRCEDAGIQQPRDASPPPREESQITDEEKNAPHATRRRSIVAPVKSGMLFMVVPSSSPSHYDAEQGAELKIDATERSLSKESRQRSADKSSSAASMAAVYGHHPLGPLKDAFDSTHASRRHSLDSSVDNHPAATRSTYSLNSNDLVQSHSNEEDSSRHRPWRSTAGGGGAVSPNSHRGSRDDEQCVSSASGGDLRNLRLPRFHL